MSALRPTLATLVAVLTIATGALKADSGIEIEGRGAVTKADGPCSDNANRYVDCGNGTVTDTVAGLVWLQLANCTAFPGAGGTNSDDWATAMLATDGLEDGLCGLNDGSEPGDWRLPTQMEWETTVAHARDTLGCTGGSAPVWTNDAGTACNTTPVTSFIGLVAVSYWSSTVDQATPGAAEVANLTTGTTTVSIFKFANASIWPVRDGQ